METMAQRCERIMSSLEDLVAQEAAALGNRDFATVLALQERTAPLVDFFVTTAAGYVSAPALRGRLAELERRRRKTSEALAAEIERARAELQQTRSAQTRVARIAPVYGKPAAARRRLQAVG